MWSRNAWITSGHLPSSLVWISCLVVSVRPLGAVLLRSKIQRRFERLVIRQIEDIHERLELVRGIEIHVGTNNLHVRRNAGELHLLKSGDDRR